MSNRRDGGRFLTSSREVGCPVGRCAHAGVINTLDFVAKQLPDRPIHAVLGGMHLLHASVERVHKTIERFEQWGSPRLAAGHCTGDRVVAELRQAFPDQFMDFRVGAEFTFVERSN